jgi:siroheme synthase (precorrin-2 oxidase/ferrochelatase)
MSKLIKEHIQVHITEEDVLGVDLQAYARGIAKAKIQGSGNRRDALYEVARDPEVQRSLATGDLQGAKARALEVLEAFLGSAGESSESRGV